MTYHATTILAARKGNNVAIGGDGQVTFGEAVVKAGAKKIRKLDAHGIVAGFAGTAADGFTLFEKFEGKLEAYSGNTKRAAIELAKEWRTDKFLRRLEALLLVADKKDTFILSGNGDVIEPDDDVAAIGSGGNYALAAAKALSRHAKLSPADVVKESLEIASSICIYTNDNIHVEELK